jgi:hypothetical protein
MPIRLADATVATGGDRSAGPVAPLITGSGVQRRIDDAAHLKVGVDFVAFIEEEQCLAGIRDENTRAVGQLDGCRHGACPILRDKKIVDYALPTK